MGASVVGILLTGVHGSRPTTGLAYGTLYSCTTHNKIYQTSDTGSTWADWSTGAAGLAVGSATRTAGDLTTSSATFVDATGMSVTITTGARRCLVVVQANGKHSGVGNVCLDILVDSTLQGGTYGLSLSGNATGANFPLSFSYITAALTAASHTFKLQWRTDGGATATLYASSSVAPLSMQVFELPV